MSMNFATVKVTLTPKNTEYQPITFESDTFFQEEEFLGEPQPDNERARLFMSNNGEKGQYIDKFSKSGKRDLTVFDGAVSDMMQKYAYANPQPEFDLAFVYARNDQDTSEVRTHMHTGCKFMNHPARAMSNEIAVVKFSLKYMKIQILDANGKPV